MILGKKIILFGASGSGQRIYEWIIEQGFGDIDYFLDNDSKKDGTKFQNKVVYDAKKFLSKGEFDNCYFIVASIYNFDICKQLLSAGVPENQIITEAIIAKWIWDAKNIRIEVEGKINDYRSILFDMSSGFVMGGVESWTYNLANKLEENSSNQIKLISKKTITVPPIEYKDKSVVLCQTESTVDFKKSSVKEYMEVIAQNLPCTVVTAHIDDMLFAASMLKQQYGNLIDIVSVIHGGLHIILMENLYFKDWIDRYFCVSIDSKKWMLNHDNSLRNRVYFKETPVKVVSFRNERRYTDKCQEPIKIAYAGRLVKLHKRVDRLLKLINELEKRKCNYILSIAGDGQWREKIYDFVKKNKLEEKVYLLGALPHDDIMNFWEKNDIYINVSECEGCCVAMLEAMACGCVPVVTDVFSVTHFVRDGVNGYIINEGDMSKMCDKICLLEENRQKLYEFGKISHDEIVKKCDISDYIKYWKDVVLT